MSFTVPNRQDTGVVLALFPASSSFSLRVERAPDNGSGAPDPGGVQDLGVVDPDTRFFFDRMAADGLVRWYRVRHWRSGWADSPATGWVRARPAVIPETLFDPQPVVPEFSESTGEADGEGTLTLGIIDPQSRVVGVQFRRQEYGQPVEGFVDGAIEDGEAEAQVSLDPKHSNTLTYRVTYYDAQAQVRQRERTVSFDIDTVPNGLQITVAVGADRVPRVTLRGDSDTGSWRLAHRVLAAAPTEADYPSDAAARLEPAYEGREVMVTLDGVSVGPNETLLVTALPFRGAAGDGTEGVALHGDWKLAQAPVGSMDVTVEANGDTTLHLTGQTGVSSARWAASTVAWVEDEPSTTAVSLAAGDNRDEPLGIQLAPGQTIYVTVWLYAGEGGTGQVTGPLKKSRTYVRSDFPQIDRVNWGPPQAEGAPAGARSLAFQVVDPRGLGGELRVWVNAGSAATPVPDDLHPEGTYVIASNPGLIDYETLFTLEGGGTAALLAAIPQNAQEGKQVYVEYTNTAGAGSGKVALTVPSTLTQVGPNGELIVDQLSDLTPDAGEITAGSFRGGGTAEGLLDLDAAGSEAFLLHPALELLADGAAVYTGNVVLDAGYVSLDPEGTARIDVGTARLMPFYVSAAKHGATVSNGAEGQYLKLQAEQIEIQVPDDDPEYVPPDPHTGGGPGLSNPLYEPPSGMTFHTETITRLSVIVEAPVTIESGMLFPPGSLLQMRSTSLGNAAVFRNWFFRATDGATRVDSETHWDTLDLITTGGANTSGDHTGVKYSFRSDGHAFSDAGFTTFSPRPPRAAEEMGAADWLEWAAEDARKPVKPYRGIPHAKHPRVAEAARRHGRAAVDVARDEHQRYAKDVSKIAIGTARWADAVQHALDGAKDFADFRRRLEAHRG